MSPNSLFLCESMFVAIISWFSGRPFKRPELVCVHEMGGRDSGLGGFSLFFHMAAKSIVWIALNNNNKKKICMTKPETMLMFVSFIGGGFAVAAGLTPECFADLSLSFSLWHGLHARHVCRCRTNSDRRRFISASVQKLLVCLFHDCMNSK